MNTAAFIESGLITTYCLGLCTPEEIAKIEVLAAKRPAIKKEIEKIQSQFESQLLAGAIKPSATIKTTIMQSVYRQESLVKTAFVPLIEKDVSALALNKWVTANNIKAPVEDFDNLFVTELASTNEVINFIVAAKKGHDAEVHTDFMEYLYIIQGSCTMNFEGKESSYNMGDIISIGPHITHTAHVTSAQPMLALVQRQMI